MPPEPVPHSILLSVVMTLQGSGLQVRPLIESVVGEVSALVSDYEIIVVDNGSSAEQFAQLQALVAPEGLPNLQIYRLLQEVDPEVAAWAGVENSLGDYVLVFDPFHAALSSLPQALVEIAKGRELVLLYNLTPPGRGPVQNFLGTVAHRLFRWLSGIDLNLDASPCRLMSKRIVSYLMQQPRPAFRYRVLPAMAGFSKTTLTYSAPRAGQADGVLAQARRAVRLLMANTLAPLRIASVIALAGAGLNLLYSCYVAAIALFKTDVAPGWTTLSLQQSGMFFLLSLMFYILAEYLIQFVKSTMDGPPYFLEGEYTSAVLERRRRLNIDAAAPRAGE